MAWLISARAALRHLREPRKRLGVHLDLARLGHPQPSGHQFNVHLRIVMHEEHLHRMQQGPVGTEWNDAQRHRRQRHRGSQVFELFAEHGGAADLMPQHVLFQHDREPVIAFMGHMLRGDTYLDGLLDVISVRATITHRLEQSPM